MSYTRGDYILHGRRCLLVRHHSGTVRVYVRIDDGHELHGETDLASLSLAIDCPAGITFAGGGYCGWYIGAGGYLSWEGAVSLADSIARQLNAFHQDETPITRDPRCVAQ